MLVRSRINNYLGWNGNVMMVLMEVVFAQRPDTKEAEVDRLRLRSSNKQIDLREAGVRKSSGEWLPAIRKQRPLWTSFRYQ